MSVFRKSMITTGYVAQYADGKWPGGWFVYPNQGLVYGTEARARREAGPHGKVYAVEISYTEVPA
jgi:hypothetical protein